MVGTGNEIQICKTDEVEGDKRHVKRGQRIDRVENGRGVERVSTSSKRVWNKTVSGKETRRI